VHAPLAAFAGATTLEFALTALALSMSYRRISTDQRWSASRAMAAKLMTDSWPFLTASMAVMVYLRIDQIMLKEFLGTKELGLFTAALPLSQIWNVLPMILSSSFAPYVSKLKNDGAETYVDTFKKIFRLYGILGVIVSLVTVLFAPAAVRLFYGADYEASATVLRLHVLSNIFIYLGVAQGLWMVNEGQGRINLYKTVIGACVAIVGNLLVIRRYGMVGVTGVYVFAQAISAVATNYIFDREVLSMQLHAIWPLCWINPLKEKPIASK
jgi:O-antigen/teichoic acid export membrane protein